MSSSWQKGLYKLRHPEKYRGNRTSIRYMSSWELNMHRFLDNNPNIIEWVFEGLAIPYIKPTDGKIHKYYVDYFVKYRDKNGNIKTELIEVKPEKQTKISTDRNSKTRLYENLTYAVNQSKWEAAAKFAERNGWSFRIITENQLFK